MVKVRIEEKEAFTAVGKKVWISGQDNSQFERFWAEANASDGFAQKLIAMSSDPANNVTGSSIFGISCVEKDPDNRAFNFFIASECDGSDEFETYRVEKNRWAIFSDDGDGVEALIKAEMYAFTEWLPQSSYKHAHAPELEVYPARDGTYVEFWLPIEEKDGTVK